MSIDLAVPQPLGQTVQFVQDQQSNKSPLALGAAGTNVGIGTDNPDTVLSVAGAAEARPIVSLTSTGNESAIRYANNDAFGWHVGSGGNAGPRTFFFWNQESHIVVRIAPDGTMSVQGGLNVEGSVNLKGAVSVGDLNARTIRANSIQVNVPAIPTAASAPDPKRLVPLMVDPETGTLHVHR